MQSVAAAVPLLLLAAIVVLVVRSALSGRLVRARPVRPARQKRRKNVTLRAVSPDRMDAELRDLIRKP